MLFTEKHAPQNQQEAADNRNHSRILYPRWQLANLPHNTCALLTHQIRLEGFSELGRGFNLLHRLVDALNQIDEVIRVTTRYIMFPPYCVKVFPRKQCISYFID